MKPEMLKQCSTDGRWRKGPLDRPPLVPKLKPMTDKWNLIKLTSFHTAKETISQVEESHKVRENLCQLRLTED